MVQFQTEPSSSLRGTPRGGMSSLIQSPRLSFVSVVPSAIVAADEAGGVHRRGRRGAARAAA